LALAPCVAAIALSAASPAQAADRIYWSNYDDDSISYANLDGSGGDDLATTGASMDGPMGMTLDPAAGRIYWANWGANGAGHGTTISYANLDGSGGGGNLAIPPGAMDGPHGLAIDPASGRIYWPNFDGNSIGFANLDGSGSGSLNTVGATVSGPRGVAIDPAAGRIYWANHDGPGANGVGHGTTISYARLNGSGGDDLVTTGATADGPEGVALDTGAGRIYWSNYSAANKISYANLDGTGGDDLATTGATVALPHGVALDPPAGRIYWANYQTGVISYANLDGSGGDDLATTGATAEGPVLPALLKAPAPAGAPTITGSSILGSTLSCCAAGSWAPDLNASLLFRAPQSLAHQWSRDGEELAGETASSTIAGTAGTYLCQLTASNAAGVASQTSAPHAVSTDPDPGGPDPDPVDPDPDPVDPVSGTASARKTQKQKGRRIRVEVEVAADRQLGAEVAGRIEVNRRYKLKPKTVELAAGETRTLTLRPKGNGAKRIAAALERGHKATAKLVVKLTDAEGNTDSQELSAKLKD
jgi:hypothetical protein